MTPKPKQLAPLRKVVFKCYLPVVRNGIMFAGIYELLECGHIQLKKVGLLGPYKAERRRCQACFITGRAK